MYQENICPECGSHHHQDFVRCPTCHAFIVEDSPWQGTFNLLAIPLALLIWWGLETVSGQFSITRTIFGDHISQGILLMGVYGMLVLFFKWRLVSKQTKAFEVIRRVCAESGERLNDGVLTKARDRIDEGNLGAYNAFIAFHRLRWLVSACQVDREERQGMLESLRQHSESDWDSLETSFSFTQFLVWLLPSVGFLGTVWGMTVALQSFSGSLGSQSDLNFNAGLMETAQGLGTAFHTTLVGLAAVIPVLAFATSCRRRAQSLLEKLDKYFLRLASYMLYQAEQREEQAEDAPAAPDWEVELTEQLIDSLDALPAVEVGFSELESEATPTGPVDPALSQDEPEPQDDLPDSEDVEDDEEDLEPVDPKKRDNISSEGLY